MSIQAALAGASASQPVLPVTHITRLASFESFVASSQVPLNSNCPRNGKKATYLFYGVPFYRLSHKEPYELDANDVDAHPIGLLIPASQMAGIEAEVYPFDTGAWTHGLYETVIDRTKWSLDDFVVPTRDAPSDAAKLVRVLFGSNHSYLFGEGVPVASGATSASAVDAVKALHRARIRADIRKRGIEIVALETVPWTFDGLVVIGPQHTLGRRRKVMPELEALLSHPGTTVIHYLDMANYSPTSDSRAVLEYAGKWLMQQGFLPNAP